MPTDDDLRAQFAELKAENVALRERVAALEAQANPPKRVEVAQLQPPFSPSTYTALDRMAVPSEITREMVRNVGTEMVQQLVRDGKR